MDSAGPAPAYFRNPYSAAPERRKEASAIVAGGADPGELTFEGAIIGLGRIGTGIEGRARPLDEPGLLSSARRGRLALLSIRTALFAATALLTCIVGFGSTLAHAAPDAPPIGFVPPVRSAPPPATRSLLLDAYALGASVFAVGERGALIRSDDSGQNWEAIDLSVSAMFTGITFADTHRGWIVGHDGAILMTNDGGLSWAPYALKEANEVSLLDVISTDIHHAITVGAFGTCLITVDAVGPTSEWIPILRPVTRL